MIKLPEPTYFTWTDFELKVHHHPYYSEAQVKQVRAEALEDAARLCDLLDAKVDQYPSACAAAIRKLKESI